LLLVFLGCFLTAKGGRITAGEPVLPAELNYVNLELQEIFRDLAETGRFRVLFAHPLQKRATMIIAAGSPVKKIITDIAANHGLTVKWITTNTAVIGDENSLAGINTSDINLHVLPLRSASPVAMAKVLETVLPSHKIRYDFKGNNIAVMANSLELENIKELVERWDQEDPIISVEVEVSEVTLDFLRGLGIKDPASPRMKAYPLPERLATTVAQSTEKSILVRDEVISLNNLQGRLFFGDRIPEVFEDQTDMATSYRIDYVDVGTTIDYQFKVVNRQKDELLLQLEAKVKTVGSANPVPERKLRAMVGLFPDQPLMLTGALRRSEYLQMKTPLHEFPFLGSLFASAGANNNALPEEMATVILLTASFMEKPVQVQEKRLPEPETKPLEPVVSPEPAGSLEPAVSLVAESPGPEGKRTPKTNTTDIPYIVKKSETLYGISRKFGVGVQEIIARNRLQDPGKIKAGATLIIPVRNEFVYTVKTGETLWRLAKRYGTTVAVLKDLNSLADERIEVGQKLVLPVAATKIANPQF